LSPGKGGIFIGVCLCLCVCLSVCATAEELSDQKLFNAHVFLQALEVI